MSFCDHNVHIYGFESLATIDTDFHDKTKEILLILRDEPILNKNEMSLPLYLSRWSLPHEIIF